MVITGRPSISSDPKMYRLLSERLQRNATPGGELFSLVNGPHAAAPEQSLQPVPAEFAGERLSLRPGRRVRRSYPESPLLAVARLHGA
jgi:hypothetical protein